MDGLLPMPALQVHCGPTRASDAGRAAREVGGSLLEGSGPRGDASGKGSVDQQAAADQISRAAQARGERTPAQASPTRSYWRCLETAFMTLVVDLINRRTDGRDDGQVRSPLPQLSLAESLVVRGAMKPVSLVAKLWVSYNVRVSSLLNFFTRCDAWRNLLQCFSLVSASSCPNPLSSQSCADGDAREENFGERTGAKPAAGGSVVYTTGEKKQRPAAGTSVKGRGNEREARHIASAAPPVRDEADCRR